MLPALRNCSFDLAFHREVVVDLFFPCALVFLHPCPEVVGGRISGIQCINDAGYLEHAGLQPECMELVAAGKSFADSPDYPCYCTDVVAAAKSADSDVPGERSCIPKIVEMGDVLLGCPALEDCHRLRRDTLVFVVLEQLSMMLGGPALMLVDGPTKFPEQVGFTRIVSEHVPLGGVFSDVIKVVLI